MQSTVTRPRSWRPPRDSASTEQAAATFTEIEQRVPSVDASAQTEEVLAPTEFHPFPAFLDPTRAQTEVVIQCEEPPPKVRPLTPARPPSPSRPPAATPAAAEVRALPTTRAEPPVATAPPLPTLPQTSKTRAERILGFELNARVIALVLGVMLVVSLLGALVAIAAAPKP